MQQRRFKGWAKQHKSFLLGYMQMMRALSAVYSVTDRPLSKPTGATIVGVGSGNQVKLDSLKLRPLPDNVVRNSVIAKMGQEIQKGSDWMWDFNWCLRYATSPTNSFITGPQPVVTEGPAPDLESAMKHPDTLIWFPISWQACLIGSLRRFDEGTNKADDWILAHERGLFRRPSTGYLVSPERVPAEAFTI